MTHATPLGTAMLIDLEQYPITDLKSPAAQALIARCRESLAARGAVRLDGFVRAEAIQVMAEEARNLAANAHQQNDDFTAYIGQTLPDSLPPHHPCRNLQRTAQAAVAYDLIGDSTAVRSFYESEDLTTFIGAVLSKERFYRSADPLAACNLAYIGEGQELGWHFDSSESSVTLQIQAPREGGVFEFVPNIRTDTQENFDEVGAVLIGGDKNVVRSPCQAGTLSIFRGHHALHRVTPVFGETPRVTAVLTYAEVPDFRVSDYSRKLFYGRLA